MLKRIKKALKAFTEDLDKEVVFDVSKLTEAQAKDLMAAGALKVVPVGDGHAEFLGEGTTEEFEVQEKKDKGQFGIFGIGKE